MVLKKDLEHLVDIAIDLSSIYNLESLLHKIVMEARAITNSEGGTIYLVNNGKLKFFVSQNDYFKKKYGDDYAKKIFKPFSIEIDKNSVAGYCALKKKSLNIKDVSNIPDKYPFTYNDYWDKSFGYTTFSMLNIPLVFQNGEVIGVLQLINSISDENKYVEFSKRYEKVVGALSSYAAVSIYNTRLNNQLKQSYLESIVRLGVASEYRDKETFAHLFRMSEITYIIAKAYGYNEEDAINLKYAAIMHDVGKLGIPDAILHKPGKLTSEERLVMEKHTTIGANILRGSVSDLLKMAAKIALTHHEKWNGCGYPIGLIGPQIPIEGRIVAIADVYDALSSKRVYKPKFSKEKVIDIMKSENWKSFDPEIFKIFISEFQKIYNISEKYEDEDSIPDEFVKLAEDEDNYDDILID